MRVEQVWRYGQSEEARPICSTSSLIQSLAVFAVKNETAEVARKINDATGKRAQFLGLEKRLRQYFLHLDR